MSAGNHNRLCRDGIFGNLQIKSKKVLDKDANLDVNGAKFRGDAKMKGNVEVCGDLLVHGSIKCCELTPTNYQDFDVARQRDLRNALACRLSNDQTGWPTNGDETTVPMYLATFTKCLAHDAQGRADPVEAEKLVTALQTRETDALATIILDTGRPFVQPRAQLSLNLVGPSPSAITVPPAPAFGSAQTAAEMVEDYCAVLCRDVAFADYATDTTVGDCVGYMNALSDYRGPKPVTRDTIFRGTGDGDLEGPFLSQLLLRDTSIWPRTQDARALFPTRTDANDRMVTFPAFLAVQNGASPPNDITLSGTPTYMGTGRDLAYSVWKDAPGQIFACAAYAAVNDLGVPFSPVFPYGNEAELANQTPFVTWRLHDFLVVLEMATMASLRTAWYAKWNAHRRARPEAFGGEVEQIRLTTMNPAGLHPDVLTSGVLADIFAKQSNHLLAQAFPEGSPAHPAYPAGHACFSGAGATVLKAFFDESYVFPESYEASSDGLTRVDTGATLTWKGEVNKLASNCSLGRDWAGVHYRSDGLQGILAGEKVAIEVLREFLDTHNEPNAMFQFTSYLGDPITIVPSSASQFSKNFTL